MDSAASTEVLSETVLSQAEVLSRTALSKAEVLCGTAMSQAEVLSWGQRYVNVGALWDSAE